ncbi:kinase-like domain-containing protein [Haematococcus lacustris]
MEDETTATQVEAMMYSCCVSDPGTARNPLVYVSPGFETLTGYARDEVLGVNCKLLQGKAPDRSKVSTLTKSLEVDKFAVLDLVNYRKDGRPFNNLVCIVPVFDGYGNLIKFVGIQCDLDEKSKRDTVDDAFKQAWQEQVRHHLTTFALCDSSEPGAPILTVSPGFTSLTGFNQPDMLGQTCLCLCGPDTSSKSMRKLVLAQQALKPTAVKLVCHRKDGSPFWAYFFSCPLSARGSNSRYSLIIIMDITTSRVKRVGRYTLGKVIGCGAYGIVRVGKAHGSDELVAIKSVDASKFRSISEIEQIQEEMNVLASLKHPNIIKLVEVHFSASVFFLIMEFASGGSLVQYIHSFEGKRLPEQEALRLFLQMAAALDFCHRRRIVHRDLKPENILMDDKRNIKIADFGLAAVTAPFGCNLTQQCGTPEFTAPEITTGKEYDGPSVDIWSMGVIMYEALTGSLPFKGSSQAALFKSIQRGVYEPLPSHLSSACRDLVRGMLTVEVNARVTMDDILRHPWCRSAAASTPPSSTSFMIKNSSAGTFPKGEEEEAAANTPHPWGAGNSLRSMQEEQQRMVYLEGDGDRASRFDRDPEPQGHAGGSVERLLGSLNLTASSGSATAVHDSLRLVVNNDKDDPITAAIRRAQLASMSPTEAEAFYQLSLGVDNDTPQQAKSGATLKGSGRQPGSRDFTPSRYHRSLDPSNSSSGTSSSPVRLPPSTGLALRRAAADRLAASGQGLATSLGPLPAVAPHSPTQDIRRDPSNSLNSRVLHSDTGPLPSARGRAQSLGLPGGASAQASSRDGPSSTAAAMARAAAALTGSGNKVSFVGPAAGQLVRGDREEGSRAAGASKVPSSLVPRATPATGRTR